MAHELGLGFHVGLAVFFFSSRRRHTRLQGDWSSDVCSSDLACALKESRMKSTNRYGVLVLAMMAIAIGTTLFSAGVGAQEEGWQITRAEYGFKNQRNEVTDILKDLIGRGGVNGRVAVNNQTMGGD